MQETGGEDACRRSEGQAIGSCKRGLNCTNDFSRRS